jgi:hypothetical protein
MFVLLTVNDRKYRPLADVTAAKNKKVYCEKHEYKFVHIEDDGQTLCGKPLKAANPPIEQEYTPMGWAKVYAMKDVMDKYPESSWIFNTDADAMITNMDRKLEDIIKICADQNTHIIIPTDVNGINCGNMFVRNSDIGRAFLDTIIAGMPLYRNWYLFENQLIQDLLVGTHLEETGITQGGTLWSRVGKVVPQRLFNSYDYKGHPTLKNRPHFNDILGTDGQWKSGDFMIQWPATSLEYRIDQANKYLKSP